MADPDEFADVIALGQVFFILTLRVLFHAKGYSLSDSLDDFIPDYSCWNLFDQIVLSGNLIGNDNIANTSIRFEFDVTNDGIINNAKAVIEDISGNL